MLPLPTHSPTRPPTIAAASIFSVWGHPFCLTHSLDMHVCVRVSARPPRTHIHAGFYIDRQTDGLAALARGVVCIVVGLHLDGRMLVWRDRPHR